MTILPDNYSYRYRGGKETVGIRKQLELDFINGMMWQPQQKNYKQGNDNTIQLLSVSPRNDWCGDLEGIWKLIPEIS